MNNRYLFKAKRIDNREWEIGNLIALPTGDYEISNKCNNHPPDCDPMWDKVVITHKVDPTTICQCTGLKDKNGKLIWGNDIVDGHIKRGAAFLNCLVLWNESKARFDVRAKGCNFPMTLDEVAGDISVGGLDYEVVGNIFDNPELLESEEFEADGELEENCDLALLTRHFKADNISTEFDRPLSQKGEKYKHFKLGKIVNIIGISRHTETEEISVVYEYEGHIWNRPLEMFMSEVDKEKYPNAKQKYRFKEIRYEC